MGKDIIICLRRDQWKQLEPHLPEGACESTGEHDVPGYLPPPLEGRMVPDEETYQTVLAIAKKECPELVREIEKARHYG